MDVVDPQKTALYAWEGAWLEWNWDSMTMPQVRRWMGKACRKYGVKPSKVTAHRGSMWTTYDPERGSTTFMRSQRNIAVTLHEAAHHILYSLSEEFEKEEFEDHGKEFLGVYIWLLNEFGVAPLVALTASARAAGLKFIATAAAEPSRFRRRVETK